jgi:hypothetical protein
MGRDKARVLFFGFWDLGPKKPILPLSSSALADSTVPEFF